ncbi:hypothetical protein ACT3TI_09895 [Psychrobacter sp. AOP22-C1-22]|uniref:hypothetical protein n=1 Tax=unclassified Psychrobacter TaxID=196806 RepID=UPI001787A710|nr:MULTISPECIES: hypothetical protein [unclassified Psychrobacter]MBE0407140.1 hypothetical protein [Psychrobacter sp. FME6]MBE0445549.1 hypothetical protein [Psychrobacter sp. FME5]MDN5802455.1 hypothetical protein [Psychrobacter sp.]MDN5892119.1 hypothetical protein [Psychrobacter sp.]
MLFEFIATIAAGFGLAGVALIITHLSKLAGKRAPKWLIPLFGAIGIFAFQIHQEYNWYDQQVAQLPEGVTVVKKAEESTWFRPWSYAKPQTFRFIAADSGHARAQVDNQDIYLVDLYLFERRLSVQKIPQVIDCTAPARADYILPTAENSKLTIKEHVKQTTKWRPLTTDDPLFINVCSDEQSNL